MGGLGEEVRKAKEVIREVEDKSYVEIRQNQKCFRGNVEGI